MTTVSPAHHHERKVPWIKIEDYVVTYPANTRPPRIDLVGASGEFVGQLLFIPDEEAILPIDSQDQARYHIRDFANVLDILRREQPIYYIDNGPGNAKGIQTGGTVGVDASRPSTRSTLDNAHPQ